jgi:hypothetical protein
MASDREQYDRLQKVLQAHVLSDYPNPTRIGCPSKEILNRLVEDRGRALDADDSYRHVIHCSPCYGEFLELIESREHATERLTTLQRFRQFLRRCLRAVL